MLQGNDVAKRLQADDKAGKVPKPLYNHYTVITEEGHHHYKQVANATFFPETAAIVSCFDRWVAGAVPTCVHVHICTQHNSMTIT